MICPICGEYAYFALTKNDFQIFECSDCAHRFLKTQDSEKCADKSCDNAQINQNTWGHRGHVHEGQVLRDKGRWYAENLAKYLKTGRVLDVGSASGFVLDGFLDNGWQGVCVDTCETVTSFGREHLTMPSQTGKFENFVSEEKFDLVSMIQVLPHFNDLDRSLLAAANATAENGYWLVEIWNRGSWTAKLFGSRWHGYSQPMVVRWFAPYDLNLVAARFGFEPVAAGKPKRRVKGEQARSLLNTRFSTQRGKDKIARALFSLIPKKLWLPHPSEDLYWVLFRKARKVEPAEVLARAPLWRQANAAE